MSIRTDLALEAHEEYIKNSGVDGKIDGIDVDIFDDGRIKVTKIRITNENGEKVVGKSIGTYTTIEAPDLKYDTDIYERTCRIIAEEIKSLSIIDKNTKTLVAGLGNREITPDALGPEVVSNLMITNHMKQKMNEYLSDDISSVCAIAPGVLGTTGIETAKIIEGICKKISPDLVIAVDALAARSLDRISTTIQLSDTGISPGSGIGNRRDGLNKKTLGANVISIGVATVADAATLISDGIDNALKKTDKIRTETEKDRLIKDEICKNIGSMMITSKDIDSVIEKASKTIANGINLALHKNLTFEDIESFVG